jgi:hypothetical protein
MKLFFDFEFTGLKQSAQPISLGIVSEDGYEFYAEFSEVDLLAADGWIKENVVPGLKFSKHVLTEFHVDYRVKAHRSEVTRMLVQWLEWLRIGPGEKFEMWGDCLAYDWVLFCELFGGATNLPDAIYYIPFDLATAFLLVGVDPDISRELYSGLSGTKHNALDDAQMIRACYQRVTTSYTAVFSLGE